jgi:hypothetical protein
MSVAILPLSLYGRGYADLAPEPWRRRLVEVGEGARAKGLPAITVEPSQDLLGNKLPSQLFLSRRGREEISA